MLGNPVFAAFPSAIILIPATLLYLFDGAVLYSRAPWAHARGLTLRRLRTRAPEDAPIGEWLAACDGLAAVPLSDGTWSTWSAKGNYGSGYHGLFSRLPAAKKAIGVVMTTVVHDARDGDLEISTHLRIGPLLVASVIPLCFMRSAPGLPEFWVFVAFALACLLGPGLYALAYFRNTRHVANLLADLERSAPKPPDDQTIE